MCILLQFFWNREEFLGLGVDVPLTLLDNIKLFSKVVVLFDIPMRDHSLPRRESLKKR